MNETLAAGSGLGTATASPSRGLTRGQSASLVAATALGMCGGYTALFGGTTGVFLLPVAATLGVGRGSASAIMGLSLLGVAVGSPLAGKLMDRFGVRMVVGASVLLFVGALMLLALGPMNTIAMSTKVFVLGLVGVATSPVGYLPILARTFERRLGLALGIASVGLGLGSAVSPVFAVAVISRFGWRVAYLSLSGIALLLGLTALYLIFGVGMLKSGVERANATQLKALQSTDLPGDTARASLTSARFWIMGVSLALVSAVGIGNMVHIPALLQDHGVSRPMAAAGATFAALGVMCGRLFSGALLDVVKARFVAALIFIVGAIGIGLLATAGPSTPYALLGFGAALTGMLVGAEGDLMPYLVRRYFGLKAFGLVYGLLVSLFSLGGLAGPILYGAAFDRYGNYLVVLGAGAAACLAGAVGILCIGIPRYGASGDAL
ncbi:MFS transporter [Caballeronia sp. 15711]|uniref:MFS transporter n=1 Tax=Caballeronia sp. 15711 TaxID=3391029 RepID=UPI0039E214C0